MSTVGQNIPHDSARGHVTGESIYIDDIPFAKNELLVDFFWSPVAHGRIRSLDLEAARRVPGVVALFTHSDLHHNLFGPIIQDELLLAEDVVTFIGQPIVVIAAESRGAIRRAKEAIVVDIERLDPVFTIDEARRRKLFIGKTMTIERGDVEAAFARAEHVLRGTFINGGQDHFYLESQAALAQPGEFDQLVVHSSTQNPSEVQHVIAHLLGLPINKVIVLTKRMGGGFGGKECQATHPAVMAALVAQRTKRPARIVFNKDDDMRVTGGRHPFQNDYEVAFDHNGLIDGFRVDFFSDGGAFADLSTAVLGRAMTHAENAYYLPNARITGTVCRTNTPPNTAFRGFGGPQGVINIENVMDEIAAFLGKDPTDVRRANLYGHDDRNVTPYNQPVENNMLPRIFDELVASSDYRQRVAHVAAFNAESKTLLRGISLTPVKFGISFNTKFLNQANALVNVYLDGSVQVSTGATEMGQGVNTKISQLVADEFAIAPERVMVMVTSTEKNNNTSATAASSGADLNGSAAVDAAQKIRARMTEVAIDYFKRTGNEEPQVTFENGEVTDGRTRVPFVEIDRFTGMMRVLRSDLLMDIGRSINPGIDRGQITGAFIQGMGWLTNEEMRYAADGELLSHSPTTYKIPNIQDLPPEFHVDWIDNPTNVKNVRASKAVGEPPLLLAISVFSAVKNALGFLSGGEIPKLNPPATGEEILLRMTAYRRRAHGGESAREVAAPAQ